RKASWMCRVEHAAGRMAMRKCRVNAGMAMVLLALGMGPGVGRNEVRAMGNVPPSGETESQEQRDARMRWWREAKFGLFIHWGVYAVPAGTWKGQQIPGIGEWIMLRAQIPVADYRQFARQFNPVRYVPDAWAALAQEA